ncbi:hypothetical protein I4U23_031549 [Adineta vaga]|nr:hypothetical protein I4U23_031549 [Adineta vaga]
MKQEAQDAYDNDAFLVAYLTAHQNSVDDKDKLCEQIAFYCQQHLPTYMVPLRWSFLDSFPTNQNGKIDRKLLPYVKRTPYQKIVSQPTTSLERQLRQIFSKAFSIESDVIDVTLSFEQLGGTSLGIIRALSLIQHSVYKHMDIHLLLTNPSVRQLGMKIESLLYLHDNELHEMIEYDDSSLYLQPSLFIEAFAMLLLMILWIFPVWIAYTSMLPIVMIVLFIVSFHLFTYTILVHILKPFVKEQDQELFSFSYYAWWFLSRLWTLNSTFWLCSLVGTPFYNAYLRMCGAHIGNNVHIYTVLIDAPWLIDISEETFIGEEVYFNHISYQNKTFELRRILIGRSCFIGAYSVLYEGAAMRDGSFVESYSAVKGNFIGSDVQYTSCSYRPTWVLIFQFLSLLAVTTVYAMSLKIVFAIHVPMIPLLLSVPLRFLLWILLSATIALLALKFVAGKIEFGNYSFYSWSYLRCLWFRRLIISFFYYPLSQIVCGYQRFSLVILSWLGMDIRGTNIEIADVIPFLLYPSHLVSIDDDVTTFGGVHLLPFYINTNGQCVVDSIKLGRGVTLGNHCLIHPGVHLPSGTLVATLTRVTQNTECADGKVLLGLPARSMPFIQPSSISNSYSTTSRFTVFKAVVLEIIANTIPLLIVSSIQLESMKNYFFIILFMFVLIYSILVCGLNRYCVQTKPGAYSFEETTSNWCHVLIVKMTINWTNLLEPFLGGTQWLIFLARGLGVRIKGSDVILSSLSNVTDYHLITIGEHVRMHNRAILQCHTFEQRVYKLAPIIVGPRSIIKSTSFILPGAKLDGANVIEPLTLIMKEEHLREGIHYYGNPARTQPGNITY